MRNGRARRRPPTRSGCRARPRNTASVDQREQGDAHISRNAAPLPCTTWRPTRSDSSAKTGVNTAVRRIGVLAAARDDPKAREAALSIVERIMHLIEMCSAQAAEAYLEAERHQLAETDRLRRDLLEDLLARTDVSASPKQAMLRAAGLESGHPLVVVLARPIAPLPAARPLTDAVAGWRAGSHPARVCRERPQRNCRGEADAHARQQRLLPARADRRAQRLRPAALHRATGVDHRSAVAPGPWSRAPGARSRWWHVRNLAMTPFVVQPLSAAAWSTHRERETNRSGEAPCSISPSSWSTARGSTRTG